VVGSTRGLCDARERKDVERFFAAHPVPASERSVSEALERIDLCVDLRTLQRNNAASWLGSHR
jgi:aminopeptidase N/puromycin-sensitive aminopeptidase